MKKLLLLSALALGTISANAEITFYSEGKEIHNGDKIVSSRIEEVLLMFGTLMLDPEITYEATEAYDLDVTLYNTTAPGTNPPTQFGTDPTIALCWPGGCVDVAPGGKDSQSGNTAEATLNNLSIHVSISDYDKNVTYVFTSVIEIVIDGDTENPFVFDLTMMYPYDASVDGILDDESPAVYYDLLGRKVENPEKGQLLIKKQGTGKATKVVY